MRHGSPVRAVAATTAEGLLLHSSQLHFPVTANKNVVLQRPVNRCDYGGPLVSGILTGLQVELGRLGFGLGLHRVCSLVSD